MTIQEFLKTSLTPFHATANCEKILLENDFQKLTFSEEWQLKRGGKYYITKNQSSVIAFTIGDEKVFNIAEAHTDSPCLKVKGNKLLDSPNGKRLNVETYGGLLRFSMLDIPLKIAGRVVVEQNGKLESKLVQTDFNVNIPSLAIHQNREVNEELHLTVQNDLLPLVGDAEDVFSCLGLEEEIVDADLFVVSDVQPFVSGAKKEFFCSPRLDNLTSTYAVINSISKSPPKGINLACCFDNEEIGSKTKQGAGSSFLSAVLQLIAEALSMTKFAFFDACHKGFILSIDNAHATHPAHPEKSDVAQTVKLGGGIVIKHNVRYATDAQSSARLKTLLKNKSIKFQDFFCNSDLACGSTVGLISSSALMMNACDIGLAQLAMHSAIETLALADIAEMEKCCDAFFETLCICDN